MGGGVEEKDKVMKVWKEKQNDEPRRKSCNTFLSEKSAIVPKHAPLEVLDGLLVHLPLDVPHAEPGDDVEVDGAVAVGLGVPVARAVLVLELLVHGAEPAGDVGVARDLWEEGGGGENIGGKRSHQRRGHVWDGSSTRLIEQHLVGLGSLLQVGRRVAQLVDGA